MSSGRSPILVSTTLYASDSPIPTPLKHSKLDRLTNLFGSIIALLTLVIPLSAIVKNHTVDRLEPVLIPIVAPNVSPSVSPSAAPRIEAYGGSKHAF